MKENMGIHETSPYTYIQHCACTYTYIDKCSSEGPYKALEGHIRPHCDTRSAESLTLATAWALTGHALATVHALAAALAFNLARAQGI